MCGIAGILVRESDVDRSVISRALRTMTNRLAHRGPDDEGQVELSPAGGWRLFLGHRRLSILDVSRRGRQPMHEPRTDSWISFNGEIYNHQELRRTLAHREFCSSSDTETLLQGWVEQGPRFLGQLRGMFAFAVYDGRRHQLWLVRDHLGVKPLYVARPRPDMLLFASEVRALLASGFVPRKLSQQGLFSYLSFGAVQAPNTMVEGITSLLPGERLCVDFASATPQLDTRIERYWQPDFVPGSRAQSRQALSECVPPRDAVERLRPVFDEAIRSQFMSDVPLGVFLSGGIDSSAIVASATRQQLDPVTFSIAFDEAEFDESAHSRAVARACGVKHTELRVTASTMLAHLQDALDSYDQPSSDGLNTFTISKAAREAGLKAALSGLGGDEGFAGYPSFKRMPLIERWTRRALIPQGSHVRATIARLLGDTGPVWRGIQLLAGRRSRLEIYAVLRQFYAAEQVLKLMRHRDATATAVPSLVREDLLRRTRAMDAVNAVSLLEMSLYMHNMLLRDTDQMSMAHGLEVRVPLLDHVLVNELARLPGNSKLARPRGPNKWLLVELVRESLPPAVVHRRKMGFVFPWGRWLRHELRDQASAYLLDRESVAAAGLDPPQVAKLWGRFQQGRGSLRYSDLLALLNLIHWCKTNQVSTEHEDN